MGHRNMKIYTNLIGRFQHRASRPNRGLNMHSSILSCPLPAKLPYLIDMTWSSRIAIYRCGREGENNAVTLKETNSNEESPAGRNRLPAIHSHDPETPYAICDSLTPSPTVTNRVSANSKKPWFIRNPSSAPVSISSQVNVKPRSPHAFHNNARSTSKSFERLLKPQSGAEMKCGSLNLAITCVRAIHRCSLI